MPAVYNGIGTWYYGKHNRFEHPGQCENCKRGGMLASYDTTEYFVVLFIPLFPIRKRRVIDECPACHKHRVIPLKEWLELRTKTFAELEAKYLQDRTSVDTARELIRALAGLQDAARFRKRAPHIAQALSGNEEILRLLGGVYAYFGDQAEAEDLFRKALAISDTPASRERLAESLVRQGKPEAAEPLLQHVVSQKAQDGLWCLILLAEGYQAKGLHDQALHVLDQCQAILPAVANDKAFRRLRKLSEKNRISRKPVKSSALSTNSRVGDAGAGLILARYVGPALGAVLLTAYLVASYHQGRARDIYLVSGLEQPYRVRCNGVEYTLAPGRAETATVDEGSLSIEAVDATPIPAQAVTIATPFWRRIFLNRTFVVNPDRAAVLVWQKTYYAPEGKDAPEGETRLFAGAPLHEFRGLDYRFEDFPESLHMSSNSGAVARERVTLFPSKGNGPTAQWFLLTTVERLAGLEPAANAAAAFLSCVPDSYIHLRFLEDRLDDAQMLKALTPVLDRKPVAVSCHIAYQQARERATPDWDLAGEYRKRLDADPGNPDLLYLAGRAMASPQDGLALMRQAAESPTPTPFALQYLATRALYAGDLRAAVANSARACTAAPDNARFTAHLIRSLLAAGQYDEAARGIQECTKAQPKDWAWQAMYLQCCVLQKRVAEAQSTVDRLAQDAEQQSGAEYGKALRTSLETRLAYYAGDFERFKTLTAASEDPDDAFAVAVTNGDLPAAAKMLDQFQRGDKLEAALTLYVAAKLRAEAALAKEFLDKSVELLRAQSPSGRTAADMLCGAVPVDAETVANLRLGHETMRLVMVAIGQARPECRPVCFPVAQRLNFWLEFPHHLLVAATRPTL
ncbi:MAG: hypothetical protein A3K19_03540 [Lentisphaerae bacterium RIFOXYB12_FULL_65_16]|nr:MAG: hypothetical protein A3K18_30170 [Lentisphaerae bacterium RIFOXYA12_64_32]OGV86587.1 MAG: hypothetical protein A3K19_03540 [Lentisphaerae bacterium RIFOXYB12_FULL_65_16]